MKSVTLLVASVACFMVILDTTVVNVAVDGIRMGLHAQLSGLQWVIDGYTLSFAALLLSAGAIADRSGPTRALAYGLGLFTLASLICGVAPSLEVLVVARIAQGIGAALLIPSTLALISRTFTEHHERTRALSIWGGIGGGAAITTGPVVGGLLTGALGWRSVFLINVPVGLIALYLLWRYVPKLEGPEVKRSLDWGGQVSAVAGLVGLTYLFIEGPHGWISPAVIVSFFLAVGGIAAFLSIESKTREPMLPLSMFKVRDFSSVALTGFALNFAFYGQLFFLNVFLQEHRHLSPAETGLRFLPQSLAGVAFALSMGRISKRVPPQLALAIGTLSSTIGLTLLGLVGIGANGFVDLLAMALIGVGIGTPASMMAVALSSVSSERAGLAGGAVNASRQVGGLLGVAALGVIGSVHSALWIAAAVMGSGAFLAFTLRRQPVALSADRSEALAEAVA